MAEHQQVQRSSESKSNIQTRTIPPKQFPTSHPAAIIQRARINPKSLTHADVMQLQRTIGNQAVIRLFSEIGLIPSTAKQAPPVQRQELVQRQEIPEEEEPLQGKFESKPEEETYPSCIQRQEIPEEEETLQGKLIEPIQRHEIPEEEEPVQGKFENNPEIARPSCFAAPIIQRQEIPEEEEPLQGKMIGTIQRQEIPEEEEPLQTKMENNTGMPDNLKAGVENLSGIDMSDVRVHYNSEKPAEVGALAYTQGTNIHVAPSQERHLPHEAWHVVQQAQERVQPTIQLKDVAVNDDKGLENEADLMGKEVMTDSRIASLSWISKGRASKPQEFTDNGCFNIKTNDVVQLTKNYVGGNPRGRGGKGTKYKAVIKREKTSRTPFEQRIRIPRLQTSLFNPLDPLLNPQRESVRQISDPYSQFKIVAVKGDMEFVVFEDSGIMPDSQGNYRDDGYIYEYLGDVDGGKKFSRKRKTTKPDGFLTEAREELKSRELKPEEIRTLAHGDSDREKIIRMESQPTYKAMEQAIESHPEISAAEIRRFAITVKATQEMVDHFLNMHFTHAIRFSSSEGMMPSTSPPKQWYEMNNPETGFSDKVLRRAASHMTGQNKGDSPFVSLARSESALLKNTDAWVSGLIYEKSDRRAPYIYHLLVPNRSLITPEMVSRYMEGLDKTRSMKETEVVYYGKGLNRYVEYRRENPYQQSDRDTFQDRDKLESEEAEKEPKSQETVVSPALIRTVSLDLETLEKNKADWKSWIEFISKHKLWPKEETKLAAEKSDQIPFNVRNALRNIDRQMSTFPDIIDEWIALTKKYRTVY